MATKKILIQVILDDKATKKTRETEKAVQGLSSKVTILNKEQRQQIINDEKSAIQKKKLINSLKQQAAAEMAATQATKQGRAQSGLNNAILLETGRLASDASYGFTAMANNLGQIVTLFASFVETNDGVVASFKELGKSLWGMGGVLIGIQLLISFGPKIIDFFTGMDEEAKKAAKSNKELAESLNDLGSNILIAEEYVKIIEDVNTTEKERKNITKELIKLIPDLKEEDFKYGNNLDLVKEKINEYATAQAARIEIDKIVEDNSEVLAKRRRIRNIKNIEDDEERLNAIKKFTKEYNLDQKIQIDLTGQNQRLAEKSNEEYISSFEKTSKSVVEESDKILDKIRELTDTSFLGGKDDAGKTVIGKTVKDKYDKEFDELVKFIEKQEELEQIYFDSLLSQEQVEVNQVRDKYFKFIKLAEDFGFSTVFLEKARDKEIADVRKKFRDQELEEEEKRQRALQKIIDKYRVKTLELYAKEQNEENLNFEQRKQLVRDEEAFQIQAIEKKREIALAELKDIKMTEDEKNAATLAINTYYNAELLKNRKDTADAMMKITDEEKEHRLETLQMIGSALTAAAELAGKNTGTGKALAVAGTLISTYSAAQKAFESQFILGDPSSKFRAILAAAAATASGLARVKAILAVKTPAMKGGSVTGGSAGLGTVQAPSFNVVGAGQANQLSEAVAGTLGQPVRAYVVTSDINTGQALERNITDNAALG